MGKISAIDIKKLWYADCISAALTPATLKALVGATSTGWSGGTAKEIENVHQDTWQIEEGEVSQDSYKNQLNGHVYRLGKKQMGDLTVSFTVGQYDYKTKYDLMGGIVLDASGQAVTSPTGAATEVGWARDNEAVEKYKTIIALTTDDVYVVIARAPLNVRESNTDKAIGLSMIGIMTDPTVDGVNSEYWYDKATVHAAQVG